MDLWECNYLFTQFYKQLSIQNIRHIFLSGDKSNLYKQSNYITSAFSLFSWYNTESTIWHIIYMKLYVIQNAQRKKNAAYIDLQYTCVKCYYLTLYSDSLRHCESVCVCMRVHSHSLKEKRVRACIKFYKYSSVFKE